MVVENLGAHSVAHVAPSSQPVATGTNATLTSQSCAMVRARPAISGPGSVKSDLVCLARSAFVMLGGLGHAVLVPGDWAGVKSKELGAQWFRTLSRERRQLTKRPQQSRLSLFMAGIAKQKVWTIAE